MNNQIQQNGNNLRSVLSAGRSRRNFLKIAGGGAAVVAGAAIIGLPKITAQAAAEGDVVENGVFPTSGTYTSKIYKVSAFNAVGAYWEVSKGNPRDLEVEIRVSSNGTNFSDWYETHADSEEGKEISNVRIFSHLVLASGNYIQYRLTISGFTLKLLGLSFIETSNNSVLAVTAPLAADLPASPFSAPNIISRTQWGANDAWRYSGGREVWTREYVAPKAIIIHHSETANTYNADPGADVRGIYRYHALTKGWGDIGYNFLIDWKGNIYEGRAGGSDVVAGHALQYNWGSVGICLVGSFKNVKPTAEQMNALVKLVAWKCATRNINPNARVFLVDKANVPAIAGHRDVLDTNCPGDAMYSILAEVRQRVIVDLNNNGSKTPTDNNGGGSTESDYKAELIALDFTPTTVLGGQVVEIKATIKNTGTRPLESQGPEPGYTYSEGQDYVSANFPKVNGKFRFTLDFVGNNGTAKPWRWGLGKTLQPGEQVTITGKVKLKDKMATVFYGGVIQEYVRYYADNYGKQPISVISAGYPTSPAPNRSSDPNIIYFPQTGHNLGYGFRTFWEKNGGLPIFGFPITEEFVEVSPTDNKPYIVQYFERNRFEYHPENKATQYEVLLGLLGNQLTQGRDFPKTGTFKDEPGLRVYFSQTSHRLDGAFLRYWNKFGGLSVFGFPISEPFDEKNPDDGKTYVVQYFERNRFEYHPEYRGTDSEVLLGLLGKEVLRRRGWLQPGL